AGKFGRLRRSRTYRPLAVDAHAVGGLVGVLAHQQVEDACQQHRRHDGKDVEAHFAGDQAAQLVDDQGHHIGEHAHVADGKGGPAGVVHLPLDGAHGGKAGGAQQVEDHKAVGRQRGEVGGDQPPDLLAVFRHFAHAKGHGQGGDDVLLGDQAAHAGGGGAPVAKAQGRKDGGDHPGDGGQQGGVGVLHGAEYPVGEAVALQEPQHHGGGQDDGAGPLDVGRAALPGGAQHVAPGGHVVGGQLHDEGGGVAGEGFGLFQDDAADDDGGDADEVSADGHQAAAAEDGAGQQADDGHLGAAGDKAGG